MGHIIIKYRRGVEAFLKGDELWKASVVLTPGSILCGGGLRGGRVPRLLTDTKIMATRRRAATDDRMPTTKYSDVLPKVSSSSLLPGGRLLIPAPSYGRQKTTIIIQDKRADPPLAVNADRPGDKWIMKRQNGERTLNLRASFKNLPLDWCSSAQ